MIKPRDYAVSEKCVLIREGKLNTLGAGMKFYIYQTPDGKVIGETLSSTFSIADTVEEYEKISKDELEKIIYSAEMTLAR